MWSFWSHCPIIRRRNWGKPLNSSVKLAGNNVYIWTFHLPKRALPLRPPAWLRYCVRCGWRAACSAPKCKTVLDEAAVKFISGCSDSYFGVMWIKERVMEWITDMEDKKEDLMFAVIIAIMTKFLVWELEVQLALFCIFCPSNISFPVGQYCRAYLAIV